MAIERWDPFSELMPLRDMMERLMEESFIMPRTMRAGRAMMGSFPVDVYETDNDVVVKASMPGMRPEDIDVRVSDNVLTISGEYKHEEERGQLPQARAVGQQGQAAGQQQATGQQQGQRQPTYYRREISRGSICREILLPTDVQADKAQATFEHGILTLTLPKAEQAKAKRIQVQAGGGQQGQPRIQQGQQRS